MNIDFTTQGTCSKRIEAEVENGIVKGFVLQADATEIFRESVLL